MTPSEIRSLHQEVKRIATSDKALYASALATIPHVLKFMDFVFLRDIEAQGPQIEPDRERLMTAVCDWLDVPKGGVRGVKRDAELVYARRIYCYIATVHMHVDTKTIGIDLGNRDHSSICFFLNGKRERAATPKRIAQKFIPGARYLYLYDVDFRRDVDKVIAALENKHDI